MVPCKLRFEMKLFNKIIFLAIMLAAGVAFADEDRFRDYDADYYLDEGKLLFKIRPFYSNTRAKQKSINLESNVAGTRRPGSLVENGYGFDTATTYFFSDYIAAELAVGVGYYKTKRSALNDILVNFGGPNRGVGKKTDIWMFPASGTLQYHIAPFGAIRPYVGLGVHGTYLYSRAKEFSVDNGTGLVFQAGCDFVARDDTFITLDVRGYTLESKINYRKEFTGRDREISSKVKWNPMTVALGFGFIF